MKILEFFFVIFNRENPQNLNLKLNKREMETIRKELRNNFLITDFQIWNWTQPSCRNYLGIVTRDENKNYRYQWLNPSKKSDEYFDVLPVKEGDVLIAGLNEYKKFPKKIFYGVLHKDDECMLLVRDTTYLKVKKLLKENGVH